MIEIVAMQVENYVGTVYDIDWNESLEEMEAYNLFLKQGGRKFVMSLYTDYGVCPSGYTTASWGRMDVKEVEAFGPFTHRPKKRLF